MLTASRSFPRMPPNKPPSSKREGAAVSFSFAFGHEPSRTRRPAREAGLSRGQVRGNGGAAGQTRQTIGRAKGSKLRPSRDPSAEAHGTRLGGKGRFMIYD